MNSQHTQLKRADLLSSAGAGVLGAGFALLVADRLRPYAVPLLALGAVAHASGMFAKHRLEGQNGGSTVSARAALVALVTALLVHAVALRAAAQVTESADSAAVVGIVAAFHEGLTTGDSAAVLALLAPEALILEAGETETRAEYRAHHLANDIAATRALKGERVVRRVSVIGEMAWIASASVMRGSMRGRELDLEGAELMVLERRNGEWRIASIHWSSHQRRKP